MEYQNVGHILEQTAIRWPGREAVVCGAQRLSYREWDTLVNRVANGLRALGVREGDHVAVFAHNSIEQVTAYLAITRCGAVMVVLNFRYTADELKPLLATTHPTVLIFDADLAGIVEQARPALASVREWITIGEPALPGARAWRELASYPEAAAPPLQVSDDEPGTMMFTSGTTGLPKAAVLSRRAEWLNALLMVAELRLRPGDRSLHIAPLFHVAPWDCMFVPHVLVGGTNVIQPRFDPEQMLHLIERERITTMLGVPTQYDLTRQAGLSGRRDLASLRSLAITGAPARLDTVEWVRANLCPNLNNIYGMTESTTLITICPPEEMHRFTSLPCIGRSLLGMEVRLVSADEPLPPPDALVPLGEPGQLICRGPKLMREYYRNPEKTAERLKDGWLYTGDICLADAEGYYYITDRIDDVINTGGEKVYPTEVERVLDEHPDILEAAVLGVTDPTWGQRIKAYVVPAAAGLTAAAVDEWLRRSHRLADYKRPREIEIVREIPRNASGKVLKKVLRQP